MSDILVVDNYDSFVYTINGYLQQLGATTTVVRNDELQASDLDEALGHVAGLLVSPGPGTPTDAGVSPDAIRWAAAHRLPMLGVCLGHQALAEVYGATVSNAEQLMHGRLSTVVHDDVPFFAGVPERFQATRYHSLAVVDATVPSELQVTARTDDGVIMALQHRELPLWGVQYHPESVLTEHGYRQFGNWLELAGVRGAAERASHLSPLINEA
ncbi:aminodeoxychorismate/anthranilate synthase component II [Pseudoclavibacter sp. CFCC 13796]|uniref:anthranilate synthase component II n=1 Tax=Pseudoclavibacter sp. CFCC 13796 TaxID=2615179 RepID=UPI00130164FA|nr:aminodeoxychorismate/anthranilate synthase component II [Pseudoclavibacter sp. CFCC 13796]KAB1660685.1 aminodeoxychorismate/anthranilate synthase component II [Pseudoclavibacter sp. CFCC 13796]